MVIAADAGGAAILNRLLRAPVEAGVALFAAALPFRKPVDHLNIAHRTDFGAKTASVAFAVRAEKAVGAVTQKETKTGVHDFAEKSPDSARHFIMPTRERLQLVGDLRDFFVGLFVDLRLLFGFGGRTKRRKVFGPHA